MINLIDTDIIKERLKNSIISIDIPEEYSKWKKEYVAVIPLWSLDFIELFFKRIRRAAQLKVLSRSKYIFYVKKFLDAIFEIIEGIIEENDYLQTSNILEAYIKNPVLSPEILRDNKVREIIDYLGELIEEDIKSHDGIKSADWPIRIKIWGKENEFSSWFEVLTTLIGMLCDQNNNNYRLLIESKELSRLEIGPSEEGAGIRRRINSQAFPDHYIRTSFRSSRTIIDLCKKAMEVTKNNPDDFQVLNDM